MRCPGVEGELGLAARGSQVQSILKSECRPRSPSAWQARRWHPNGVGDAENGHASTLDEPVNRRLGDPEPSSHLADCEQIARFSLHH